MDINFQNLLLKYVVFLEPIKVRPAENVTRKGKIEDKPSTLLFHPSLFHR